MGNKGKKNGQDNITVDGIDRDEESINRANNLTTSGSAKLEHLVEDFNPDGTPK